MSKKKSPEHHTEDAHQLMNEWLESWDGTVDKDDEKTHTKASKHQPQQSIKIDLHGLTSQEAIQKCDTLIPRLIQKHRNLTVRIITGRGIHSKGRPILADVIYNHVRRCYSEYIVTIDSSPMESKLGGLPIRGWFQVQFKK